MHCYVYICLDIYFRMIIVSFCLYPYPLFNWKNQIKTGIRCVMVQQTSFFPSLFFSPLLWPPPEPPLLGHRRSHLLLINVFLPQFKKYIFNTLSLLHLIFDLYFFFIFCLYFINLWKSWQENHQFETIFFLLLLLTYLLIFLYLESDVSQFVYWYDY